MRFPAYSQFRRPASYDRLMSNTRKIVFHDLQQADYEDDLEPLSLRAHGRILELGAGTGRVALHLASKGLDVTALDYDPALLAVLRYRAAHRGLTVKTICADVFSIPRDQPPFDTIICSSAFHELVGPRDIQRSLYMYLAGKLAEGGVLILDPVDLDGLDFPSAKLRKGLRRAWLEAIVDYDDGRSVFTWRRQEWRWGRWRDLSPMTQVLWPSDPHADASPAGLRVVEHLHVEDEAGIWPDLNLYSLMAA